MSQEAFIFVPVNPKYSMHQEKISIIEKAWNNRELLNDESTQIAIREVIDLLDKGLIRVAEPKEEGVIVNQWI